jgi:hypothetical protein
VKNVGKFPADRVFALGFIALGLFLVLYSRGLPPGMESLPGPGFLPTVLGIAVILLATLLLRIPAAGSAGFRAGNLKAVSISLLLTTAYLALWGTGGFVLRTAVFLILLMRFLGEGWIRAATVAVVLAGGIFAAFTYGLGLRLD